MARTFQFIGLAALSFALTGCVTSTDKYRAAQLENEQLRNELANAQSSAGRANAERDAFKNQLAALMDGSTNRDALLQNNAQQIANLQAQLAETNAKYQDALGRTGSAVALPPEVTSALDTFAAQNADLVDFDRARGIVKFKTDFTFATGSDQVTDKAKAAIGRFAQILNSDAARPYELMVAGHTDDTPVVNSATKARHPDNWYLSSHRAIAVGTELTRAQVSSQRVAVVGYADQRPIASNASAAGKAQNRRVEVLILPSTIRTGVAKTNGAPTRAGNGAAKPALNKDTSVSTPAGPVLNK